MLCLLRTHLRRLFVGLCGINDELEWVNVLILGVVSIASFQMSSTEGSPDPLKTARCLRANCEKVAGATPYRSCVERSTSERGWRKRSAACSARASTV